MDVAVPSNPPGIKYKATHKTINKATNRKSGFSALLSSRAVSGCFIGTARWRAGGFESMGSAGDAVPIHGPHHRSVSPPKTWTVIQPVRCKLQVESALKQTSWVTCARQARLDRKVHRKSILDRSQRARRGCTALHNASIMHIDAQFQDSGIGVSINYSG